MGTYAVYRVWVGLTEKALDRLNLFDHPFVKEILDSPLSRDDDADRNSLKFEEIFMHGRRVGIGVIVYELEWTDEIDATNLYDPSIADKTIETVVRVGRVFSYRKILMIPEMFHCLDLGG